jgi:hypothetical protein
LPNLLSEEDIMTELNRKPSGSRNDMLLIRRVIQPLMRLLPRHPDANRALSAKKTNMMRSVVVALTLGACAVVFAFFGDRAISAQDRYTVQVPGGLAFSEFRGYENWPVITTSENDGKINVILGNPAMIEAFRAGVPGNGKPFPDGTKLALIHWIPKKQEAYPGQPTVAATQEVADFMVKDSKRFADTGGWGWAEFEYDAASDTFRPGTLADTPPQGHDAKCGFACHTIVKNRDYVFTEYAHR